VTADNLMISAATLRHFHHLHPTDRRRLFLLEPEKLSLDGDRELLAVALGATLYTPADHPQLASRVIRCVSNGVCSMVLDLEDAIEDVNVASALRNVVASLDQIGADGGVNAMIFVRVRSVDCIDEIVASLTTGASVLTGFVVPKFTAATGGAFLAAIADASQRLDRHLFCMPVLESAGLVYRQTRADELERLGDLLALHRDQILALRIGTTDMCSVFGLRRGRDLTIYDVRVVADVIADVVNYFGRADGSGFLITAPVWEYFAERERIFRPTLRSTPFVEHDAIRVRDHLVNRDLDGLLREIGLDHANGLQGKTVIHPSHVVAVHAFAVVTHEEYHDALDILAADSGGVSRSGYGNKMNEARPHHQWAQRVLRRSRVFGVANEGVTFVDLLTAGAQ
jgi:citrate lyase beta subunit